MNAGDEVELAVAALLERGINAYLALDPATLSRLGSLSGRVIGIELTGLSKRIFVAPHAEGVQLMTHFAGEPDALLRGTPLALAKLSLSGNGDAKGLFSGEVTIEGDIELGQSFKRILDEIDIDWEELLSRVTGDVVAYRTAKATRELGAWGARAMETLGRDVTEYLQYESADLVDGMELERFLTEVDGIRDDAARLEARVRRLARRLEDTGR